jgi:hypothetical protein
MYFKRERNWAPEANYGFDYRSLLEERGIL